MYTPKIYEETRPEALESLITAIGFGILIAGSEETQTITHLPFLWKSSAGGPGILLTHMARPNRAWQRLQGARATVVLQGPHAYVSPTWSEGAMHVPTWNYVAIHAHGMARLLSREELRATLADLVAHFETKYGSDWSIDSLSPALLNANLDAIVGVAIDVDKLEGKQKLSQNLPLASRQSVIAALAEQPSLGARELANWMRATVGPI